MTTPTVIPVKTAAATVAAATNTHGPVTAAQARQALAELIAHNKKELATSAAAVAAVAVGVGVHSRAKIAKWAGEHPRAAVAAGALIGGAAGAVAAQASVAAMIPVADKVTGAMTKWVTTSAQAVARHSTPLVVAGGALTGGAAGAAAGRYLAHHQASQAPAQAGEPAPGDGAEADAASEAVPDNWLARLQKWATGEARTAPQQASPEVQS